ncbi:hypothetical protein RQP46_008685 [Phenoliferia psychrophenolica]
MPVTTTKSKAAVASPRLANPTHSPHWTITAWFAISTLIVFWDAGFCLLRPRSMEGGDLFWMWIPYKLYATVDYVYGVEAFKNGDGFTSAQAILNLFENAINITYLGLAYVKSPLAVLVGFTGVLFTFWKTVLYWLMDQQCGWCQTGHNSAWNWWVLFAFPNFQWILIPGIIAVVFGREIATGLRLGAKEKVL